MSYYTPQRLLEIELDHNELIELRLLRDRLMEESKQTPFTSGHGPWRFTDNSRNAIRQLAVIERILNSVK